MRPLERLTGGIQRKVGRLSSSFGFMAFVDDDSNRDEARKLGLLRDPAPTPEPLAVRVVPDAGTPASGAAAG